MSEKRKASAKALVIALVVANLLFFAYARFVLDTRNAAASRIDDLQINPGRIKLMNTATRGPGGGVPKSACLEWGPFTGVDTAKVDAALSRIALAHPAMQRTVGEGSGGKRYAYYVREPDAGTVARIAELQRSFPGTDIKAGPCPS